MHFMIILGTRSVLLMSFNIKGMFDKQRRFLKT